MEKKVIAPVIPAGFVVLLEKGQPINVNKEAGKALVKSDPTNYAWPKGKTPKVKPGPADKSQVPPEGKPEDHTSDGKFTLEDVLALPHKEIIALAKKLNVSASGKGEAIAKRIMEAAS